MNKRLLVLMVLCFFVFSMGVEPKDKKADVIEFLVWANTGAGNIILDTTLNNPAGAEFTSEPFLTFHVPASPKSKALFMEGWGQSRVKWWYDYSPQSFNCTLTFELISDIIPQNIDVFFRHGLTHIFGITHNFDSNMGYRFEVDRRNWKIILRRDSLLREYKDNWEVMYSNTEDIVPSNLAQDILNDLMDKGFDVEVSAYGRTEGVRQFLLYAFIIEVNRLSAN